MTPAALARYRLRPVPWGWLALLATGWLLGTRLLVELPIDPGMGITVVRWTALLLGLGGAVLAAPETDPPQDLLRAGPVPHWRTLAMRLAGWLALGAAPIQALAALLDGTAGWTAADLAAERCRASAWRPRRPSWPPPGPRSLTAAPRPWRPRSGWPRPGGPGRPGSRSSSPASPATAVGNPAGSGWSGSAWPWPPRRCWPSAAPA